MQPSLTGAGARVAIVCNVTPASSQSEETLNTLRFAAGAKKIKVRLVLGTEPAASTVLQPHRKLLDVVCLEAAIKCGFDQISQVALVRNEVLDVGTIVARYECELQQLRSQLAALSGAA